MKLNILIARDWLLLSSLFNRDCHAVRAFRDVHDHAMGSKPGLLEAACFVLGVWALEPGHLAEPLQHK